MNIYAKMLSKIKLGELNPTIYIKKDTAGQCIFTLGNQGWFNSKKIKTM